jgi:zinc-binding alcohol dehydrogenase family protein
MKAFGFTDSTSPAVLFEQSTPQATGRDILVAIHAVAVNPVDIKLKSLLSSQQAEPKIVGFDAMGTIIAKGDDVEYFNVGDEVYYAGDASRPGCYASHQLVDERIVALAPSSLSQTESASLALTAITAWEALFSRLKIIPELDQNKTLLIIGGAGGVGSMAIQLAKQIVGLTVVTTASRAESEQWCRTKGADYVINHHNDLAIQYYSLGIAQPDYILCLNNTDQHFSAMAELVAPQGLICSIVGTQESHDLDCLKSKSAGFVWEFMFTRPMFKTADLTAQHHILKEIAQLIDSGRLTHNLTETIGPITSENLEQAHRQLLSGNTIGKIALTAIVN